MNADVNFAPDWGTLPGMDDSLSPEDAALYCLNIDPKHRGCYSDESQRKLMQNHLLRKGAHVGLSVNDVDQKSYIFLSKAQASGFPKRPTFRNIRDWAGRENIKLPKGFPNPTELPACHELSESQSKKSKATLRLIGKDIPIEEYKRKCAELTALFSEAEEESDITHEVCEILFGVIFEEAQLLQEWLGLSRKPRSIAQRWYDCRFRNRGRGKHASQKAEDFIKGCLEYPHNEVALHRNEFKAEELKRKAKRAN